MNAYPADNLSIPQKIAVWLNRHLPRGKGSLPRRIGGLFSADRSRWIATREGALLAVEPTSLDVYACILNSGRTWNWHVLAACASVLRPGQVFYDIGANVGFMSMEIARVFRDGDADSAVRVVSFEPLPQLADAVAASARLNNLSNFIIRKEIVSDCEGTAVLFLGSHSIHASTQARESRSTRLQRPVTRIDALVQAELIPPPSVIKIDVEGGELAAFRGAAETIHRHRPHIVFESDENAARFGYSRRELLEYLQTLAPYRFFHIAPRGDTLLPVNWDSDPKNEPEDILATVLDDAGVSEIKTRLARWAPDRRIDIRTGTGAT